MAKETAVTSHTTSPPPQDAAAQEHAAVSENRTVTMRAKRASLAPLPGGRRVDASRYMRARYTMRQEADILGDPEGMLTDDWRREHRGWSYQWPIRSSNSTASYIRSGWFVPVPFEAVNPEDPCASIAEIVTPGGRWVVWKAHVLVAVPPEKHDLLVTQYEDYAISRTASNPEVVADALNRANPGFEAEVSGITGLAQER